MIASGSQSDVSAAARHALKKAVESYILMYGTAGKANEQLQVRGRVDVQIIVSFPVITTYSRGMGLVLEMSARVTTALASGS